LEAPIFFLVARLRAGFIFGGFFSAAFAGAGGASARVISPSWSGIALTQLDDRRVPDSEGVVRVRSRSRFGHHAVDPAEVVFDIAHRKLLHHRSFARYLVRTARLTAL
jgi:hypothetical protein